MFTNVEDALVGLVRRFAADCGDIDEWEYADLVEAVAEDSSPTVAAELRKRFFYPDITVRLVGEDGNAFIIIGRVRAALRKNGCSSSEVAATFLSQPGPSRLMSRRGQRSQPSPEHGLAAAAGLNPSLTC